MQIKIENIPSHRIAYLRRIGPYGTENRQIMEKLKKWAKSRKLLTRDSVILGIAQDNPETTAPGKCRYDTCIVIPEDFMPTGENIRSGSLPGGKYAVFRIEHTEEAVRNGWNSIFPELAAQNYSWDAAKPIMERYIPELVENHYCEICVPVK